MDKISEYVLGKISEMFDCDKCALTDHQANHLHDMENYIDTYTDTRNMLDRDDKTKCIVVWGIEDVLGRAEELKISCTEEQAKDIIGQMERHHDCCYGITWETIDAYLQNLTNCI